MKSIKYGLATAALAAAFTTPALADVDLFVLVTKEKDVYIKEYVDIEKFFVVAAFVNVDLDHDAEAFALANVTNVGNFVGRATPNAINADIDRTNTITASVNNNSGAAQVNQDSGNMVNQANLVSYGLTGDGDAVTTAEASADQFSVANVVAWGPVETEPTDDITISATISGSIQGNTGIVGVNQNAGNMNNQTNAVALAVGIGSVEDEGMVALAEADLGQFNALNRVTEVNSVKTGTIAGSVTGNSGITHVSQAVGNNSNQANFVAVSVTLR
ncbi:MAG: hypothetical protein QNJ30_17020 [Kiloniellales bacterium]|nr:hypothetical protein [Kiloniellales bacterium]